MTEPIYAAPFLCFLGGVLLFFGITPLVAAIIYPAQLRLPDVLRSNRYLTVLGPKTWQRVHTAVEGLGVVAFGLVIGLVVYSRADVDGDLARICPAAEVIFGIVWTGYLLSPSGRIG